MGIKTPIFADGKRSFAIHNLGCKVNEYESNVIAEQFATRGYIRRNFDDFCDVYIVNTCAVTEESGKKSLKYIRRARRQNPLGVIVAAGCFAQARKENGVPQADIVVGTKDKTLIVDLVDQFLSDGNPVSRVVDMSREKTFEKMTVTESGRTRATVKIQDGCDNFCTYCLIPYLRGRIRSKELQDIEAEVSGLVQSGYKEIVLTGIHLDSYGADIGEITLCDALEAIDHIEGLRRVRLGSLEPVFVTEETVSRMKNLRTLCHQFHLSLQSGSSKILKLMRRRYTPEQYLHAVNLLRSAFEDAAITTDVIVGFPCETREDFEDSYRFVEKLELSRVHVFPYSLREGTVASTFEDQVSAEEKALRANEMNTLAQMSETHFYQRQVGRIHRVLIEKINDFVFEGYTGNYVQVRGVVALQAKVNDIVEVEIVDERQSFCIGKILKVM